MSPIYPLAVFGGFLLVICASTGVQGLSCLMCNSLMSGKWEPCPESTQYHSMTCRQGSHYCIKINGNQTITNMHDTSAAKTTIGIQRNCGTPYNMKLFNLESPEAGCRHVDVHGAALTAKPNPDGTFPNYDFDGQICVCKADNCNQ